jgi:hypothetical protein
MTSPLVILKVAPFQAQVTAGIVIPTRGLTGGQAGAWPHRTSGSGPRGDPR